MAFPSDILLPSDARYYQFVETDLSYNSNYDIVWSLQFKLPEGNAYNSNYEYAFGTFLTSLTGELSSLPGQYVGDTDPLLILGETQIITEQTPTSAITTEGEIDLVVDSTTLSGQLIKVVFDSTGLYGLSGRNGRSGVGEHQIKKNSISIRDYFHDLVLYEHLSAFSPTFSLTSDEFQTLRVRYANLGTKISIDKKVDTKYQTLTTIELPFRLKEFDNIDNIHVGYSFCTPISTQNTALSVGNFFLKNAHIEGLETTEVLTQTIASNPLSFNPNTSFTTVSNITAIPA
tara:strand:+ start:7927 stop:8790 length:864 start_codon:yes stop_codon:yes gene_type:complete